MTNAEVAAALFTPSPKIYNIGTTKLPPPLPIRPEENPKTDPLEIPNTVFLLSVNSKFLGFQPLSISIAAAAVLIFFVFWGMPQIYNFNTDPMFSSQDIMESDPLMAEIADLSENALPPEYLDIAADAYTAIDDEFMEFIVPPPLIDDTLSFDLILKGAVQC